MDDVEREFPPELEALRKTKRPKDLDSILGLLLRWYEHRKDYGDKRFAYVRPPELFLRWLLLGRVPRIVAALRERGPEYQPVLNELMALANKPAWSGGVAGPPGYLRFGWIGHELGTKEFLTFSIPVADD